jgi:hypothetical protein
MVAKDHLTCLLAGGDEKRRLILESRHDVGHAVPGST